MLQSTTPQSPNPDDKFQSLQVEKPPLLKTESLRIPSKVLYEETYYISGMRSNYLILVSENMQMVELPLGLIHQDIKIGQPVRLKIEYDHKKHQADELRFKQMQKDLYREYSSPRE